MGFTHPTRESCGCLRSFLLLNVGRSVCWFDLLHDRLKLLLISNDFERFIALFQITRLLCTNNHEHLPFNYTSGNGRGNAPLLINLGTGEPIIANRVIPHVQTILFRRSNP